MTSTRAPWQMPDAQRSRTEVTIMTNHETEPGIRGYPGSSGGVCGLVPGHREPHQPAHVRQKLEPIKAEPLKPEVPPAKPPTSPGGTERS